MILEFLDNIFCNRFPCDGKRCSSRISGNSSQLHELFHRRMKCIRDFVCLCLSLQESVGLTLRERRQEGPSPAAVPFKAPFVPSQAIGGKKTKDGGKFGYRDRARERREGAPPEDLLSLLKEDVLWVFHTWREQVLTHQTSRPKQLKEVESKEIRSHGMPNNL